MAKKKDTDGGASPLIGILKDAIRDSGISLNELSKRTGVSNPQISRFMRGDRSLTLPAAEKLVEYFGMKLVKVADYSPLVVDKSRLGPLTSKKVDGPLRSARAPSGSLAVPARRATAEKKSKN
jgi:transcriptional regulator with XRE-family HTH domain